MKLLSSSIVILAGAVVLAGGVLADNDIGQLLVLVGGGVGLVGFCGWISAWAAEGREHP